MYSEQLRKELRKYITPAQKFGPHQAEVIENPECRAAFFEYHYDHFPSMLVGSDMVVGRRGSGKTSLLNVYSILPHLKFYHEKPIKSLLQANNVPMKVITDRYISVPVDLANEFVFMQQVISDQNISSSPPIDFLARFWRLRILQNIRETLERYLDENSIADKREIKDLPKKLLGVSEINLSEFNRELGYRLSGTLTDLEKEAIITVDTLDDQIDLLKHHRNVFGALLKTASEQISAPLDRIHVKIAIPLEAIEQIEDAVSNPDKVMFHRIYLNWRAWHLLRIALHRLRLYYHVTGNDIEFAKTNDVDLASRSDVLQYWHRILPSEVRSIRGTSEPAATYMLRHTQLMPRQLIMILNKASQLTHACSDQNDILFTEDSIRKASNEVDKMNAEACLGQFEKKYCGIRNLAGVYLKNVPRFGSYSQYHKAWTKGSHRKQFTEVCRHLDRPDDFDGFLQMLWEIGIIGRCRKASSDNYVEADFRFNTDSNLQATENDQLCVHPMFSRAWRCLEIKDENRAIRPIGTDAYSEDD